MLQQIQHIVDWLLPRSCVACGFAAEDCQFDLCKYCKAKLPWLQNRCYQCGARLLNAEDSIICYKCQAEPPNYDRLCALFAYEPPLTRLINSLKFGRQLYPAKLFAGLLYESVTTKWYVNKALPELIIPVPLHIKRHRQRGYNQAIELGYPLAKALNIPFATNACTRVRATKPQARLKRLKRLQNLRRAFQVNMQRLPQHIALIDDVVTTGSTISSVSLALRTAEVQIIDVWCVCR